MPADLFISYSSADQAIAERLRDDLESDGFVCWMAPRDVPPGGDYARIIPEAIRSSHVFLLLLSASANASAHIEREVHLAATGRRPIVPVRLDPVEPEGPLVYLLANVQRIDAFPRIEPHLGTLRAELRRLLERQGVGPRPGPARTRFQRVVASSVAWLVVLGLTALLVVLLQRAWFNLVPPWSVPLAVMRHAPGVVVVLLLVPLVAMGLQYAAHRSLARVATLDALFAIKGGAGPRVRAVGAAVMYVAVLLAILRVPPTVSVVLEAGPITQYNEGFTRVLSCAPRNYIVQAESHYLVRTRVGRLNPPGQYTLRVDLRPYATSDGVEWCEIRLDERFGVNRLDPIPDDPRQSAYVEVEGSGERFWGSRALVLSVTHYRDVRPSEDCWISATLSLAGFRAIYEETRLSPSIWPAE